jgi:Flp pilus assembly protein TadD
MTPRNTLHDGKGAWVAALLALTTLTGCVATGEKPQAASAAPAPVAALDPRTTEWAEKALAQDRLGDARKLVDRVLAVEPANARARLVGAELHLAQGQTEAAAAEFEALSGDAETGARALQGLGIALIRMGETPRARTVLKQAVELDPKLWRAWNGLGYLLDLQKDTAGAERAYGQAIAVNERSAVLYNNRGFSRLMQRKADAAVEDFRRALQIDPQQELAKANLRLALAWQGHYAHAAAGTSGADNGRTLNNVGYVALMRGDLDAAERYLAKALTADAGYNSAAARNLAYLKTLREFGDADSATPAASGKKGETR